MRKSLQSFGLSLFVVGAFLTIAIGFLFGIDNPIPWIMIAVLIALPYVHKKLLSRQFVQWDDKLSVGIGVIDEDHKKLLGLINNLQTAAHYHTGEAFERQALDELVNYTKFHFQREEDLMQANGYADFPSHKQQHEAMILEVGKMLEAYETDRARTIEKLCQFLKKWLINHIAGTDQAYAPYLHEKGVH
jgi:hemerythrin